MMTQKGWALGALCLLMATGAGCGDANLRRGDQALARQDFPVAITAYRAALDNDPDNVQVRYQLVDAIVQQINVSRSAGTMPLDQLEASVQDVHEIVYPIRNTEPALRNALVQLHFALARNYGDAQLHEKAHRQWQVISELQPNAESHFNMGNAASMLKDWEGAIAAFNRALELDKHYVQAHRGLGSAYIQLRRDPEAVEAFRTALAIEPLDYQTRYNLGVALQRTGQVDAALAEFDRVIKEQPSYPLAYRGMRNAWERKGDPERVLEWDLRWREKAGLGPAEGMGTDAPASEAAAASPATAGAGE